MVFSHNSATRAQPAEAVLTSTMSGAGSVVGGRVELEQLQHLVERGDVLLRAREREVAQLRECSSPP